jgi:hypothetical protein
LDKSEQKIRFVVTKTYFPFSDDWESSHFKMLPINRRIQNYQRMLVVAHKHPHPDKDEQKRQIKLLTVKFKMLLTEKARQEAIHDICDDNGRDTKNTGSSEADDPRPRICIRDILKEKIAGCR